MLNTILIGIICATAYENTMTDEEFHKFYEPISAQGLEIVKSEEKGNGVFVQKKVNSKDPVLCVNEYMRIYPYDKYELSEYVEGFTNLTALKTRVLYEKFMAPRGHFITEYVHSLPTFIHHYANWTVSQREYFKSLSLEPVNETELLEVKEYESIVRALAGVNGVPEKMLKYETFLWVSFHVKSRYFWCQGKNGETVDCMYPFLDLVNFEPIKFFSTVQEFFRVKDGKTCLVTSKDLSPGDEFVIDYVIHRAPVFFLDYAIIQENYDYDSLEFEYEGKLYFLYAFRLNSELLEEIVGEKLESCGNGKLWKVVNGLREYRKKFVEYFRGDGIRKIRREYNLLEDDIKKRINRFGVSIRTTYYNHLNKIDTELLKSLWILLANKH